jgi:type II secretory pathway pseudopilin PulG
MFLRKPHHRLGGFTLIELAIVLGVVGVLGASLWRLMATSNQQSKDLSTAQQQQQLISSIKGWLASSGIGEGQNWMTYDLSASTSYYIPLPTTNTSNATCTASMLTATDGIALNDGADGRFAGLCNFLPSGFTRATTNPYGQTYVIRLLKDTSAIGAAPQTYSFMVIASGAVIPDIDGGRISSMIGGDGGFIYSSSTVCGLASPWACGALGAWSSNANTTYGFTVAQAPAGAIASRTFVSPSADNSNLWLARGIIPSDSTLTDNTMDTNIYMGQGTFGYLANGTTAPNGSNIFLETSTNPTTLATFGAPVAGAANIYMGDGTGIIGVGSAGVTLQGSNVGSLGAAINPSFYMAGDMTVADNPGGTITGTVNTPTATTNVNAMITILGGDSHCQVSLPVPPGITPVPPPCQFTLTVHGDSQFEGTLYADYFISNNFQYLSSDRRMKKDIKTLSNPLDDVMKINPVSFKYKSNNQESMGVIAQELEKIYPQLVIGHGEGYRMVSYDGLIAPLIGAVQELKKENDGLREQLQEQAARQEKMDQELAKLRQQ